MQTLAHQRYQPPPQAGAPPELDSCIERVLAGEEDAWPELMATLHPLSIQLCRYRLHSFDGAEEDLCRDVASKTLERLSKANFAALRRYAETRENYPSLRFSSWLRVVVGNVCIDHLRTLPDHQRRRDAGTRSHHVNRPLSLTHEPADTSDVQRHVEIRRVLAWLADPAFPNDQREALALWMRGYDAAEISSTLGLTDAAGATRLLRAGRQRLRRHFEERQS